MVEKTSSVKTRNKLTVSACFVVHNEVYYMLVLFSSLIVTTLYYITAEQKNLYIIYLSSHLNLGSVHGVAREIHASKLTCRTAACILQVELHVQRHPLEPFL